MLKQYVAEDEVKLRDQDPAVYPTTEQFFQERIKIQTRIEDWHWFLRLFTKAEHTVNNIADTINQITQPK